MRKVFRGGKLDWLLLSLSALTFLLALLLPLRYALSEPLTEEEQLLWDVYQKGEIIRLHVVANSDSAHDQSIKLAVRDAVVSRFGDILIQAGTIGFDEANDLLAQHVAEIEETAAVCARNLGFEGHITAESGVMHLPEKKYGQVVLPEGEYHALRITLGSGQGANWWCVLYPQLCLALAEDGEEEALTWHSKRIWQHWLALPV